MNRYVWKNIVLAGTSAPSGFEKAVAAMLIVLALILCGWGPMG